ncbi:hypothetical protein HELRODRAFT_193277 [Helobdella robusta]|uniref:Uncharacterized protein n=1 Tax=Helobdella robusta TaxID=6412 RepID=T1FUT6_HELRO|nr:hypothetical protein HELRODRAFT_193277 [Helobdella robusta]ESN97444.1 hypothetical protein HELRODRAFT_193277 [Helobdella robusta]
MLISISSFKLILILFLTTVANGGNSTSIKSEFNRPNNRDGAGENFGVNFRDENSRENFGEKFASDDDLKIASNYYEGDDDRFKLFLSENKIVRFDNDDEYDRKSSDNDYDHSTDDDDDVVGTQPRHTNFDKKWRDLLSPLHQKPLLKRPQQQQQHDIVAKNSHKLILSKRFYNPKSRLDLNEADMCLKWLWVTRINSRMFPPISSDKKISRLYQL